MLAWLQMSSGVLLLAALPLAVAQGYTIRVVPVVGVPAALLGAATAWFVRASRPQEHQLALSDQQEVGDVEVVPGHSTGQALKDALVVLDRLAQARLKLVVAPALFDASRDRTADLLGHRNTIGPGNRFELGGLCWVDFIDKPQDDVVFDRELLVDYLAALGIAVDDPDFYGDGRTLRQRVPWKSGEVTVAQYIAESQW